jgi:hypothetical protein
MIFKIIKDEDFFVSNPEARIIDAFSNLSSEEMKFMCLVYDYDSPFRKIESDKRKYKVLETLKFEKTQKGQYSMNVLDMVHLAAPKFKEAKQELESLMFDEDQADLSSYRTQKQEIRSFLMKNNKTPLEMKNVKIYVETQGILDDKIKEIEEKIRLRDEKEYVAEQKDELGTTYASLVEVLNEQDN